MNYPVYKYLYSLRTIFVYSSIHVSERASRSTHTKPIERITTRTEMWDVLIVDFTVEPSCRFLRYTTSYTHTHTHTRTHTHLYGEMFNEEKGL